MIGTTNGVAVSITGLGVHVPARVVTNNDMAELVDTSDEWIVTRTGIRERRFASEDEALSDIALPAAREALERAGVTARDIDLLIVATVTPDMQFPSTAAIMADLLGATDAAAYDLAAGCTGFMYAIAQGFGMLSSGLSKRALVVGADVLSKLMNMADRSTCVLFGDGAGAVVLERVAEEGFLAFELGADGGGGMELHMPAGGSRMPTTAETVASGAHYVHMNGREVFKFATRVLVSSAEQVLDQAGLTVDDVDVYVPHQANVRIIDHAVAKLGIPPEKVIVNVDRYGNTSSASIPLALHEGLSTGLVKQGDTLLMTGMGAGLTWGSAVMRWTADPMSKIAFCFPGQGSLETGMGRDVAEAVPEAMAVFERGSEACGLDLKRLCFDTRLEEMVETEVQQPALVATSLAMMVALQSHDVRPDYVIGHSVGEFAALAAAKSVGVAETIALVRERGLAMAEAVKERPGSMAAILGLDDEVVERLCRKILGVWPANYNCPGQIVVSGENDAVDELCAQAEEAGARRTVKLKVSGAFHSPLVARAAERLRPAVDAVKFGEPQAAFMSTVTARFEEAQRMGALLVDQLTAPVRFTQAAGELVKDGVKTFVEVGPGNVLSGLMKRIDRSVKAVSVNDLASLEKVKELLRTA